MTKAYGRQGRDYILTDEEIAQFHRDGYVTLDDKPIAARRLNERERLGGRLSVAGVVNGDAATRPGEFDRNAAADATRRASDESSLSRHERKKRKLRENLEIGRAHV